MQLEQIIHPGMTKLRSFYLVINDYIIEQFSRELMHILANRTSIFIRMTADI